MESKRRFLRNTALIISGGAITLGFLGAELYPRFFPPPTSDGNGVQKSITSIGSETESKTITTSSPEDFRSKIGPILRPVFEDYSKLSDLGGLDLEPSLARLDNAWEFIRRIETNDIETLGMIRRAEESVRVGYPIYDIYNLMLSPSYERMYESAYNLLGAIKGPLNLIKEILQPSQNLGNGINQLQNDLNGYLIDPAYRESFVNFYNDLEDDIRLNVRKLIDSYNPELTKESLETIRLNGMRNFGIVALNRFGQMLSEDPKKYLSRKTLSQISYTNSAKMNLNLGELFSNLALSISISEMTYGKYSLEGYSQMPPGISSLDDLAFAKEMLKIPTITEKRKEGVAVDYVNRILFGITSLSGRRLYTVNIAKTNRVVENRYGVENKGSYYWAGLIIGEMRMYPVTSIIYEDHRKALFFVSRPFLDSMNCVPVYIYQDK